jgi:hypothetical protein
VIKATSGLVVDPANNAMQAGTQGYGLALRTAALRHPHD